jgi:hypothetical protein
MLLAESGGVIRKIIICLCLCLAYAQSSAEDLDPLRHYSTYYLGLGTEIVIFPFQLATVKDDFRIESISAVYTWGKRDLFRHLPVRFRIGLGFWVDSNFALLTGFELGFLEWLNRYQARMLGLYGVADMVFRTRPEVFGIAGVAGIKTVIPLNNLSCLGFTVTYDSRYKIMLKFEYSSGVYLLK